MCLAEENSNNTERRIDHTMEETSVYYINGINKLFKVDPSGEKNTVTMPDVTLGLAISPDHRALAVACAESGTHMVDPISLGTMHTLDCGHSMIAAFSTIDDEGQYLAVGGSSETPVHLFAIPSYDLIASRGSAGLGQHIHAVCFSPSARLLVVGICSKNQSCFVLNVPQLDTIHELVGHSDWVYGCAFLSDSTVVTASRDRSARAWDAGTGEGLAGLDIKSRSDVTSVAASPNGALFATGSADGWLIIYDTTTHQRVRCIHVGYSLPRVHFINDDVVISGGQKVELIDVHTGDIVKTIDGSCYYARGIASSLLLSPRLGLPAVIV